MLPLLRSSAALALLATASTAQTVTTVDPGGGPNALVDAVALAQAGDLLVVLPGLYEAPSIDKPLQIYGSGDPEAIQVDGKSSVSGLALGENVVLRGLTFASFGTETEMEPTLGFTGAGSLWVEDCIIEGAGFAVSSSTFGVGMSVDGGADSPTATFVRCTIRAGDAFSIFGSPDNYALSLTDTAAFVYDCAIEGAQSSSGPAPALLVSSGSDAFLSGGSVVGAEGRPETVLGTCETDGGPAVRVFSGALTVLDANVLGGPAGLGNCGGAQDGDAYQNTFGTIAQLPGDSRSFQANSPVTVGQTLSFEFEAEPGDFAVLALSADSTPTFFPTGNGAVLGTLPALFLDPLGLVPASGSTTLDIPLAPIGSSALTLYAQAAYITPALELYLAPGSALLLLP